MSDFVTRDADVSRRLGHNQAQWSEVERLSGRAARAARDAAWGHRNPWLSQNQVPDAVRQGFGFDLEQARKVATVARLISPRLAGGPIPQIGFALLEMLARMYPNASEEELTYRWSEGLQQMHGAGRQVLRFTQGGGSLTIAGYVDDTANQAALYPDNPYWDAAPVRYRQGVTMWPLANEANWGSPATWDGVNSVVGDSGQVVTDYLPAIYTWWAKYYIPGPGSVTIPGEGQREGLVAPYPDVHPRQQPLEQLGQTGLPDLRGGNRSMPFRQARQVLAVKERLGLAETYSAPGPERVSRETDSAEVWPQVKPAPPHQYVRPGARRRDIKIRVFPAVAAMKMAVNSLTETGDFVEQIWKSIPEHLRKARRTKSFNLRMDAMLRDIFANYREIDWDAFKANYEANQMEDLYYGATSMLATAAGIATRRGAGGFGMSQALGLHDYAGRPYGQGRREHDPVDWSKVDPVKGMIDRYNRWAIESRRRYIER